MSLYACIMYEHTHTHTRTTCLGSAYWLINYFSRFRFQTECEKLIRFDQSIQKKRFFCIVRYSTSGRLPVLFLSRFAIDFVHCFTLTHDDFQTQFPGNLILTSHNSLDLVHLNKQLINSSHSLFIRQHHRHHHLIIFVSYFFEQVDYLITWKK